MENRTVIPNFLLVIFFIPQELNRSPTKIFSPKKSRVNENPIVVNLLLNCLVGSFPFLFSFLSLPRLAKTSSFARHSLGDPTYWFLSRRFYLAHQTQVRARHIQYSLHRDEACLQW